MNDGRSNHYNDRGDDNDDRDNKRRRRDPERMRGGYGDRRRRPESDR